jgi:hypothetical protein
VEQGDFEGTANSRQNDRPSGVQFHGIEGLFLGLVDEVICGGVDDSVGTHFAEQAFDIGELRDVQIAMSEGMKIAWRFSGGEVAQSGTELSIGSGDGPGHGGFSSSGNKGIVEERPQFSGRIGAFPSQEGERPDKMTAYRLKIAFALSGEWG